MISQDDIDAFKDDDEAVVQALEAEARSLGYEFHPDYLFNILKICIETQIKLSDAQMQRIAQEGYYAWCD